MADPNQVLTPEHAGAEAVYRPISGLAITGLTLAGLYVLVVAVSTDGEEFSAPRELFSGSFRPASNANSGWDVAPDGRFLRVQQAESERLDQIDIVLGFDREVEAALSPR